MNLLRLLLSGWVLVETVPELTTRRVEGGTEITVSQQAKLMTRQEYERWAQQRRLVGYYTPEGQ